MNTEKKQERPILIIDGLNVFVRHYLVNESVNNKSEPVGGVVGFIKFLDYITTLHVPQKIYVAWETGGGSARRRALFKEYKKDRGKIKEMKKIQSGNATMRDQLAVDEQVKVAQLALLYKIIKTTPVCQIFVSGTEADDIVAYLTKQTFRNHPAPKIIVSEDHDYYQVLEDKNVTIYDPSKRNYVTGNDVYKTYGIAPRNFCLAQAIVGDTSDNIEGVPGVGLKTVAKRFPQLADRTKDIMIKDIMDECDKQIAAKAKQKVYHEVKACEEVIRRNWKLMYLDSSMLSATEIQKIQYIVENHQPKMNKLQLVKEVINSGMSISFDFDQFSSRLRNSMTV